MFTFKWVKYETIEIALLIGGFFKSSRDSVQDVFTQI